MSYTILVQSLAERDLLEAQEWYEARRPGLGDDFRLTIDGLPRRIANKPLAYPVVYHEIRRAVVRRFPYLLYFMVRQDIVTVVACLHSKRSPRRLRTRVPLRSR